MAKFRPGDIIFYEGRKLRVRQQSFVGFERDAHKGGQLYDLTDIDSGQHFSIPISEVEEGLKEIENIDPYEDQYKELKTRNKAAFLEHSDKTYWEQMEGKIEVSKKQKNKFNKSLIDSTYLPMFDNTVDINTKTKKQSKLKDLWNKLTNRG